MRVLLLDYEQYSEDNILKLKNNFTEVYKKKFSNIRDLKKFLRQKKIEKKPVNIIFTSFGFFFDKDVIKYMDNKKRILASPTTSLTHIDYVNLSKSCKILSLKDKNLKKSLEKVTSTSELTVGLILSVYRKIHKAATSVNKKLWNRNLFVGNQIYEKKVGIIGFGRIGKMVANTLKSMGAKIYIYDRKRIKISKNYNKKSIFYIFKNCDIISLHISSEKENYKYIGKKFLKLMNKNSIIINTARGEILDENYLYKMLKNGKISGAGLDVLIGDSNWKKIKNNNLVNLSTSNKNLVITPHIGGCTFEASKITKTKLIDNVIEITK